jgi:hypothetical protein
MPRSHAPPLPSSSFLSLPPRAAAPAAQRRSGAMSKPIDYSKWDAVGASDSDDEAAPVPPPPRRAPPPSSASTPPAAASSPPAAAASPPPSPPAPAGASASVASAGRARVSAADVAEYEARRPGRLKRQLDDAMALLRSDMAAATSAGDLAASQALPALDAVRWRR